MDIPMMIQYAERIAAQQECLENVGRRTEVIEKQVRQMQSDVSELRADVRTLVAAGDAGTIRLSTRQAVEIVIAIIVAFMVMMGIDVGGLL